MINIANGRPTTYFPVSEALNSDTIDLHGSRPLSEIFERWWPLSSHAQVQIPPEPLNLRQIFDAVETSTAE